MIIWFESIEFVTEATHQQLLMLLPNISYGWSWCHNVVKIIVGLCFLISAIQQRENILLFAAM